MTNPKHPVSQELGELIERLRAIRKRQSTMGDAAVVMRDAADALERLSRPIPTAPQSRDGLVKRVARRLCYFDGPDGCGCVERCEHDIEPTNIWHQAATIAVDEIEALRTASGEATEPSAPLSDERTLPNLLTDEEQRSILSEAEELWRDLQSNKLGGFSGINRPFYILAEFKRVIEKYGNRDVGLTWSKDELDRRAALSASIPFTAQEEPTQSAENAGNIVWRGEEWVPLDAYREAMSGWKAALTTTAQGEVVQASPVAYRYVHLDYAGRKVSRYGTHAERVNGHDPIEVHPLYDHRLAFSHPSGEVERVAWQDTTTAPKDGTIVELVIDYSDGHHPLHDATLSPTIGQNSFDNTGVDEWQFAGWNWCQDVFNQGQGKVVAWRPSRLNAFDDGLSPLPLSTPDTVSLTAAELLASEGAVGVVTLGQMRDAQRRLDALKGDRI